MRYLETLGQMGNEGDNKVIYLPYEATGVLGALGGVKACLRAKAKRNYTDRTGGAGSPVSASEADSLPKLASPSLKRLGYRSSRRYAARHKPDRGQ
ncbi:MAG: hypothetical protein R3F11_11120 [Verrucomicrobiales bacterium]